MPVFRMLLARRRRRRVGHRPRPPLLRRPQAHRARARRRRRLYFPSLSARTLVYKGMLTSGQLAGVLPRPRATSASSRAIALVHSPLLHQHVPVVAAGPPVPLRRPQRRDQHGAGQRELDAGPRGAAAHRRSSPASSAPSRSARPASSDTAASTRRSSCCTSAAARLPARRADDDPGGVGEPRVDARRQAGVLRVPRLADGAVGRPGVGRLHRRHRHRRRARPQRPAPQPLLGHRRRPRRHGVGGRRARHPGAARSCRRAASSPGRMFLVDTEPGPHHRRRRDQDRPRRRAPVRASGSTPASSTSRTCPPRHFLTPAARLGRHPAAHVRLHAPRS